jgi:GAF domain-containing protein
MREPEIFTRQLSAAARLMEDETGTQETLEKAVLVATEIIAGCDMAGISIVHRNGIDTPACSHDALRRVDELQYRLEQGPCRTALQDHEIVHSPDLGADDRWPKWGPEVVAEVGMHSVVSFRLFTTGSTLGAMNLYSATVDAFGTEDIYNALALSAHVAVALAAAQNAEHLEQAVVNRTTIGQAEGILMERFNISADRAFAVLRRVSQERNVKLNQVAEELCRTRRTPGSNPEPGTVRT